MDARHATESQIVPPQVLPFTLRTKFSTLIRDVATTGDSGSGVFDPSRKCLLGIISGKLTSHTTEGDKNIAKMNRKQRRAAAKQPHAELASTLSQALALHQAGRLAEAEQTYLH